MRKSGSWQSVWDDRILEWMDERGEANAAPRELVKCEYIRCSKAQVVRRLQAMHEHGLVKKAGRGRYILTEEGERYLDEKLDAEKWEPPKC